jgi:rhodanese-related sulfurtransferase
MENSMRHSSRQTILTVLLTFLVWFTPGAHAAETAVIQAMEEYLDFVDYLGGTILPRQIPREDWKDYHVIDTRDADQYKQTHIPGAVNIDWRQVLARRAELPKGKMILLYCNGGTLSAQAAFALKLAGVENVLILQGGFNQWKEEGGFDASRRATQPVKH